MVASNAGKICGEASRNGSQQRREGGEDEVTLAL